MADQVYAAVDIGASGGRLVAGIYNGRTLRLETVSRFANTNIELPTGWHWNLPLLFAEIKAALAAARGQFGDTLVSMAIDTWGVDYGFIDARGRLLGLPWMYRDSRTDGMIDAVARVVPREEIYRRTGIQFLPFNTLYQLAAEARDYPEVLKAADQLLFVPDLLTYWLTGVKITERTIASTAQMLKAGQPEWDLELAAAIGVPARLLQSITEPCTIVGQLLPGSGCAGLNVVACGGHDTASAVAGVPATPPEPLFLSSGTWSLIGRELSKPLLSPEAFEAGFSNEHGLCGTTRFLKNVTGMWLIQECMRCWKLEDASADLPEIIRGATACTIESFIDPDDAAFQKSCDMPAAIVAYLKKTRQPLPVSREELTVVILQSLALRYRALVSQLRGWMPDLPDTLHVVGGGSQNALLNQMTADATGLQVVAGPVEATAAGNILAQLLAAKEIRSLEEGRAIVRTSFEPRTFAPGNMAAWDEKMTRSKQVLANA